ncbi:MAG: hypothetical protein WBP41_11015, partial [Saprospiraceae bacterium]
MTIFFQNINRHAKFNLLILSVIALFQSCSNYKTVDSEKRAMNEDSNFKSQNIIPNLNVLKSAIPRRFLDTVKLKEMGISYQKLGYLILTDTMPKSEQILGLTYQMIANIDNDYVLFQLDSLFVKLPNELQAFGFDEFGPYFHSYESLLKPDILFDDYNFDGKIDFSIYSAASGNSNETRNFYIFNSKSRKFNNPLLMNNTSFDRNKKLVYQGWNGGHAGKIGGVSTYRFTEADSL